MFWKVDRTVGFIARGLREFAEELVAAGPFISCTESTRRPSNPYWRAADRVLVIIDLRTIS
jgi:hypothetical protein